MRLPNREVPIFIGENVLAQLPELLKKRKIKDGAVFVVDSKVKKKYAAEISAVTQAFPRSETIAVKAGEEIKSFEGLSKIFDRMLKKKFGRDSVVVAIGGGVIGDLAGFAAAVFARGIKLAHVPTTLLAMVDSSIGGKTGINYGGVKNIVGAFYQPEFILCDVDFLQTLPRAELISGLGETVKYGILADEKFFAFVEKNLDEFLAKNKSVLETAVYKSAKIKASVVEQDEKEAGLRKILNLGHTFAHAFESASEYKLAHGKAVLLGIYAALLLSEKSGFAEPSLTQRYADFLSRLKKDFPKMKFSPAQLYSIMLNDKKNRDGKIKFVLPIDFGEIALDVEADKSLVFEVLEETERFVNR